MPDLGGVWENPMTGVPERGVLDRGGVLENNPGVLDRGGVLENIPPAGVLECTGLFGAGVAVLE